MNKTKYSINDIKLDEKSKQLLEEIPYVKKAFKFKYDKHIIIDIPDDVLRYIFYKYDNRIKHSDGDDNFIIDLLYAVDYLGLDILDYIEMVLDLENPNYILELLKILPLTSEVIQVFNDIDIIDNITDYSDEELIFILNINAALVLSKEKEFSKSRMKELLKNIFFYIEDVEDFFDILTSYTKVKEVKVKYLINNEDRAFNDLTLVQSVDTDKNLFGNGGYSVFSTFYSWIFEVNSGEQFNHKRSLQFDPLIRPGPLKIPLYKGMILYLKNMESGILVLEEYKIVSLYNVINRKFSKTKFDYQKVDKTISACVIEFDKDVPVMDLKNRNKLLRQKYGESGVVDKMYFSIQWDNAFYYSFYAKVPKTYLE